MLSKIPYEMRFEKWFGYAEINSMPYMHLRYSDYPEVKSLAKYITSTVGEISYTDTEYITRIICNLYLGYINHKCVGIPRAKAYWNEYNKRASIKISYRRLIKILDLLKEVGLVSLLLGEKNDFTDVHRCSRYWATPLLYNSFNKIYEYMVHEDPPKFVTLRDNNKNDVYNPKFPEDIRRLSDFIKRYCIFINTHWVYTYRDEVSAVIEIAGIECTETVYDYKRTIPTLTAIYSRNSWNLGGRLYTSDYKGFTHYQKLSQKTRKTLKFNDQPVCELDFKSLHITMLYHQKGLPYTKDAYSFMPKEERTVAKLASVITINAKDKKTAIYALMEKTKAPLDYCTRAVEKFIEFHAPISEFICSDKGIELQKLDASIMVKILEKCMQDNIPVLPFHDSVICRVMDMDYVRKTMASAYKSIMNFPIKISLK